MDEKTEESPLALPLRARRNWRTSTRLEIFLEWLASGSLAEKISRIAGILVVSGLILAYATPEPVGAFGTTIVVLTLLATMMFLASKTIGWLSGYVQVFDVLIYWELFLAFVVLLAANAVR
jgi:hypothetical protein